MTMDEFFNIGPYEADAAAKTQMLSERINSLTEYHRDKCRKYSDMLDIIGFKSASSYLEAPFLPVRLFKELELKSVSDDEVVKTVTSSGTTGQSVSRIFLDRNTSSNQQKAMVKIVSDFLGPERIPMIIIDCPSVVKDRRMFSARGAGVLGFSIFGSKKIYALNDDMTLNVEAIAEFIEKYKDGKILLFGFTFMVWQHFYMELLRLREEGITFDLSNGILIHGGGWKKLSSMAVSRDDFHRALQDACGIKRVHDYYGMAEQTGCIYMECECGHLHASVFSDVIMRRPLDFSICDIKEEGIIQVVSSLPESYPGHSLLTEDKGMILGEDDCPCGRKGKYFSITGRLKNAEIRGCSDTYADMLK
ncbi:MAG: acyl-protein synthetase [Lachnospiraceae bacterium]|nr:acyl-protein synthetase [Lachnospiraceae bacterium]